MKKKSASFSGSEKTPRSAVPVRELRAAVEGWLIDSESRRLSPATVEGRRIVTEKLLWFLEHHGYQECGTNEIRAFLAYLSKGHENAGGRWGNGQLKKQAGSGTVFTYYMRLRTLFRWMVKEELLDVCPMDRVEAPIHRPDQIQPLPLDTIQTLLSAAKRSTNPKRDEAILLLLLDTGMRASELCGLLLKDVDATAGRCEVLGKGNKRRQVVFQSATRKALWSYLRLEHRDPDNPEAPLFPSSRGRDVWKPLTRSGLRQLLERLAEVAGLSNAHVGPHKVRHSFAVEFLKAGAPAFTVQQMLGHTSLAMTRRYVNLAQADVEAQHRQFSPVERLRVRKR